jgi:hypothetical protein
MGVAAFSMAVIQATEAYFCPIKHQRRKTVPTATAVPYVEFEEPVDFNFDEKLERLRRLQTNEDPDIKA